MRRKITKGSSACVHDIYAHAVPRFSLSMFDHSESLPFLWNTMSQGVLHITNFCTEPLKVTYAIAFHRHIKLVPSNLYGVATLNNH